MTKPREFWILESRCTGKAKPYKTQLQCWDEIQHNDNEIHVREIIPIDWNKVWFNYWSSKERRFCPFDDILIQKLVEKQLRGEE